MQAVHRLNCAALQNDPVTEAFHAQGTNSLFQSAGNDKSREAPKVRIHYVDRHLHCVEAESGVLGNIQHLKVNAGVFMAGKADETYLACLFGCEDGFHRSTFIEDTIGIVITENLVVLEEIDVVDF